MASAIFAADAHAEECSPEHAAMGHCTAAEDPPAPDVAAVAADEDTCTPDHSAMGHCTPAPSIAASTSTRPAVHVAVRIGVLAAQYRTPLYEGSYQGAIVGATVSRGRFSLSAEITEYQLVRNGLATWGPGDVMLHLHGQLFARGRLSGGAMLMSSVPTGDDTRGFGMGHVMLMPEAWVTWSASSSLSLSGAIGGGYAFGGAAAHAKHGGGGTWPLVDPMNARELSFDAGAMYMLAPTLGTGIHVLGAAPIGDGRARVVIAGRVSWTLGRAVTTFEIAGGAVGDPFALRGILGTTINVR